VALLQKITRNLRHPMSLRHPVRTAMPKTLSVSFTSGCDASSPSSACIAFRDWQASAKVHRITLQHTATFCNTLQHITLAEHFPPSLGGALTAARHHCKHAACSQHCKHVLTRFPSGYFSTMKRTAVHCNTPQRNAMHCNALQRTATHCNAPQRTATHPGCNTLHHNLI